MPAEKKEPATVRVRLLATVAGPGYTGSAGDVVSVSSDEAKALLAVDPDAGGAAEGGPFAELVADTEATTEPE